MRKPLIIAAIIATLSLAGCMEDGGSAARQDQQVAATQLSTYQRNQPVPVFDYSQLRQNLIEIETAQAHATVTTSFMFARAQNGSTGSLVHWCPSIGFPIPATYSLTSPDQPYTGSDSGYTTISQLEANGVFTGDTTATYVICVDKQGKAYAFYHEGDVSTVAGPARWNNATGEIELTGDPTAKFTSAKK